MLAQITLALEQLTAFAPCSLLPTSLRLHRNNNSEYTSLRESGPT